LGLIVNYRKHSASNITNPPRNGNPVIGIKKEILQALHDIVEIPRQLSIKGGWWWLGSAMKQAQ
jgi:hypothetical protein